MVTQNHFKIKMPENERKLTNEQVKDVVNKFIVKLKDYIIVKKGEHFYGWIHRIAKESGFIEDYNFQRLNTLTRADILKCVEQIWNYVMEGILAPGASKEITGSANDIFFPYLHITEKGKKIAEGW
jgi:hypothetical protein